MHFYSENDTLCCPLIDDDDERPDGQLVTPKLQKAQPGYQRKSPKCYRKPICRQRLKPTSPARVNPFGGVSTPHPGGVRWRASSASMARWSSPKDPALEAALRRNRRWVVNNQIKRLLLRFPSRTAPVRFLQSRFKTLDLMGRAANWLSKYPSCFEVFSADDGGGEQEPHFGFTKRMAALVHAEEAAVAASEPAKK